MAQFRNVACWFWAFMKTGDVEDDCNMELSRIFKGKIMDNAAREDVFLILTTGRLDFLIS